MRLSAQGLDFISRYEGCVLHIYQDSAGFDTIGFGHLITPNDPDFSAGITTAQAKALLAVDSEIVQNAMNSLCRVPLNQYQFDALVDFTFNLGAKHLSESRLLRTINARQPVIENLFTAWAKAGGFLRSGLLKRREAEWALYAAGDYGAALAA